jgi:4-aminobutyrate aminotransferase-like enzyme/Ser/Thr protein kinase RdoA (MazF antagonist)
MNLHWQNVLKKLWKIEAKLTRLDGEYDLNFMATGKRNYILKVMRAGCQADLVDLQCQALDHIANANCNVPAPKVIELPDGAFYALAKDEYGENRIVWLQEKIEGHVYAKWKPHSPDLQIKLGAGVGALDQALSSFHHPALQRVFKWNLAHGEWIGEYLEAIEDIDRQRLIADILQAFQFIKPALDDLPKIAIHNDLNDYNIIIDGSLNKTTHVAGLIDLGDMCAAPRICDLAILAAYIVLDHPDPETALAAVVKGYHSTYPLTAAEVDMIWPLLRMRLAVSVVNSTLMAKENPDDPYVTISETPAWAFLETGNVNAGLIAARLRTVCGLPVTDAAPRIQAWLDSERGKFAPIMGQDLADAPMGSLSVENTTVPQNPFDMTNQEACGIDMDAPVWLGYYAEPRLIYTDMAFRKGPWKASNRRTVHLAVDVFMAAGTKIHAPMKSIVEFTDDRKGHLDYGGMVILRHETPAGDKFFTLYGHLDPGSFQKLEIGQSLKKGEPFAALGSSDQNGGWAPHIHFQLAYSTDGMGDDWAGVADPDELYLWCKLCPNPAAMLNLPDDRTAYPQVCKTDVLTGRREMFGQNLKLTYADPVMFLRGWKHHLFDEWGRPYLDAYNNVPHVGHAHPRIASAATDQLKRVNSNTRYLHPSQIAFAEKVTAKLPDSLSICFFVNSGSEANELALRLARAHTGGKDVITPDHGYHGNTTGAIEISAYKFNAKGGDGQADWVHLVDVADDYRGKFKRDDPMCAQKYAGCVDEAIDVITNNNGKLAGFIAETFPSVGGQIIPPEGYLTAVYAKIRAEGGVCIADEVQTGLGRLGIYNFGFEQQNVVPDIVVLGKPIGNGHPIGVVITSREIADSFATGPEYFSTFGGSNLSCRIGKEVLDIVDDEGLMENARIMGDQLLDGLHQLQDKYEIIGDIRGYGLFIGVDLVTDRASRKPGTQIADYIKNRMRENRILIGTEGPKDNILKIRPPLTIETKDVAMLLTVLDQILEEVTFLTVTSR